MRLIIASRIFTALIDGGRYRYIVLILLLIDRRRIELNLLKILRFFFITFKTTAALLLSFGERIFLKNMKSGYIFAVRLYMYDCGTVKETSLEKSAHSTVAPFTIEKKKVKRKTVVIIPSVSFYRA